MQYTTKIPHIKPDIHGGRGARFALTFMLSMAILHEVLAERLD